MLSFGAKSCTFRLLQTISQAVKVAVPTPPGARAVVGSALGRLWLIYLFVGLEFFLNVPISVK